MAASVVRVASWSSLWCLVGGNFFSSLQSNLVVNLDFGGDLRPSDASLPLSSGKIAAEDDADATKLMTFAGGKKKFRCRLPSGGKSTPMAADMEKLKTYFRNAKLAPYRGKCLTASKDYWTYDVCFGRKIVQYRPDTGVRFSLGEHSSELSDLSTDGSVKEWYTGGTDNRSSEVRYSCAGKGAFNFKIEETEPLVYIVTIGDPAFCAWRDQDGAETRDDTGQTLKASALLEPMRSECLNVTHGWWTYEYCFPHTIRQFHLTPNGERQTEYTLGTINGTGGSTERNQVSLDLVRLKPTINSNDRRAPPSSHRTLQQRLGGGNVCDETNRARASRIHFQCPPNWQARPEPRIVSIQEATLCEYEVMIHTVLLCGHQGFVPALPKGKEEISCMAEPDEL